MKYFLDTEFQEYKKSPLFSKPVNTIELISIGIVSEDDREYYAVSKDFDLRAAWKMLQTIPEDKYISIGSIKGPLKEYWLRDNVLKPIFRSLYDKDLFVLDVDEAFTFSTFKHLVQKYGKSNEQIAKEIIEFVYKDIFKNFKGAESEFHLRSRKYGWNVEDPPEFYAYYADYDWVVFCWLFGKMIELPAGFPMYCRDLKQMLDEKLERTTLEYYGKDLDIPDLAGKLNITKARSDYPQQSDEHNALADAKWNKQLFDFIESLT